MFFCVDDNQVYAYTPYTFLLEKQADLDVTCPQLYISTNERHKNYLHDIITVYD